MTRLTVTIPHAARAAVNAALAAKFGPIAADTFSVEVFTDAGTPAGWICSWDLAATGHADALEVIEQTITAAAKTGSGKTAKTASILRADAEPVDEWLAKQALTAATKG